MVTQEQRTVLAIGDEPVRSTNIKHVRTVMNHRAHATVTQQPLNHAVG